MGENELKPREKLLQLGANNLSTEELLAIRLGTGVKNCDVFTLAHKLAEFLASATIFPDPDTLYKFTGLGRAKTAQILACLELSGRYILSGKAVPIRSPEDVAGRLSYMKYEPQEHLVVVTLNSSGFVINIHELTTGLVNQTPVHPREAFAKAVEDRAVSVIFAHNHPSGSVQPSGEDWAITRVLCASGHILQIPVLDHLIIGKCGVNSMCRLKPEYFEKKESFL